MPDAWMGTEPLNVYDAAVPQVHQRLRDLIVAGELKPGARLSETEIAHAYAVSRQPVREAFIRLVEEGLLEVRPQRGSFVSKILLSRVLNSQFMREAIEADIVRLAVNMANAGQIEQLRNLIAAQKQVARDGRAFVTLDDRFHRLIADAAEKRAVWDTMGQINLQKDRVRQIAAHDYPIDRLIGQHEAIVDAIDRRDQDGAEAMMRQHLQEVLVDLPRIVANYPEYFDAT